MRITIDYTSAVRQRAGVGRYTRNLVDALAEVDRGNAYTLFCAGDGPTKQDWPAELLVKTTPVPERFLTAGWHKLRLAASSRAVAARLTSSTRPTSRCRPSQRSRRRHHPRSVLPQAAPSAPIPGFARISPSACPRQSHVPPASLPTRRTPGVTSSSSWAHPPEKSRSCMLESSLDSARFAIRNLGQVRERYHLPELFVLFVGTIEPRKNLSRLISAYGEMRRQTGLPHQLVISGSKGWLYEDIFAQVEREGLSKDVLFPGSWTTRTCLHSTRWRTSLRFLRYTKDLACRRSKRWRAGRRSLQQQLQPARGARRRGALRRCRRRGRAGRRNGTVLADAALRTRLSDIGTGTGEPLHLGGRSPTAREGLRSGAA